MRTHNIPFSITKKKIILNYSKSVAKGFFSKDLKNEFAKNEPVVNEPSVFEPYCYREYKPVLLSLCFRYSHLNSTSHLRHQTGNSKMS